MTLFNIPGLVFLCIAVAINGLLSIFVYRNNPKSTTNRIFGMLGIVISLWLVCMYAAQQPLFSSHYLSISRLTFFLATPMDMLFFLLARTLPSKELGIEKRMLTVLILVATVVMVLAITPYTFQRVELAGGIPKPIPGLALPLVGGFNVLLVVGATWVLFRRMRRAFGRERDQFRFVAYGIGLMFGFIVVTIFFPVLFLSNAMFVVLTPLYALIFLGMTAYAIIVHRLLDIRLIIARAISFILLLSIIGGAYAFVLSFLVEKVLRVNVDTFIVVVMVGLSLLGMLTFQPLQEGVRKLTHKIFFQDRYDSDAVLSDLTKIMVDTIDLDLLTHKILEKLSKVIGIDGAAFLVVDKDTIVDVEMVGYGEPFRALAKGFEELFHTKDDDGRFVFEELEEGALKSLFRTAKVSVAIPINVESREVAILLLGQKLSGDVYTEQDLNLLSIFASESGIAIQNAKSYEEIKKFNQELEGRVAERTKELEASKQEEVAKAQEVSKLKDEFVFFAVHELRAPVTAIKGFLDMTTSGTTRIPKAVKTNLDSMAEASEHLTQLVNDLLEIARSDSGTIKLTQKPYEVAPILAKVMDEVEGLVKQKGIALTVNAPSWLSVVCDAPKLKEILMNLVSNAIKYNKDKGSLTINIRPDEKNKFAVFEIADTGFGIPKDQQEKIFQKFFRASSKDTQDIVGTGLGLFICRMLLERMGGTITFASTEGKGTTFTFTLPLSGEIPIGK